MTLNMELGRDAKQHIIIWYFHHTDKIAINNYTATDNSTV